MSKALDHAELIATRLATAPATGERETTVNLPAIDIIVDRQKNVLSDITKAVAKAGGTAIVILWQGFTTIDKNASAPRLAHRYTITVYSKPVIAGDDLAADDVMESVIQRLWQWIPAGYHANGEVEVQNGGMVPDRSYLIYDCEITIPASL